MAVLSVVPPSPVSASPVDGLRCRTIHGYRRAFVHVGRGPALLLIHGIGDSAETWRDAIASLSRDHTVVAPDLLGHGRSDKPRADYSVAGYANAMRDLLAVLEIERATIVGHSLGGGIAMQLAYQYPEHCERLVLVSPGGVGPEVHPMLRLASGPLAAALPLLRVRGARAVGHLAFALMRWLGSDLGRDARDLQRVFDALPDAATARAFVRALRASVDRAGQAVTMLDRCYLAQTIPTLMIWGGRDAVVPFSHAARARAAMPWTRLEVFEDAGHFPHHHDPARFDALLREFLAGTAPAVHDPSRWRQHLRGAAVEAAHDAARSMARAPAPARTTARRYGLPPLSARAAGSAGRARRAARARR